MLTISVNGSPIAIPSDTALTLEQSAAWADIDNISADIIWTFTIPAAPNALLLGQAHYVVVSQHRRYPCTIAFCGTPIANGDLYIQDSQNEKTLSCGVTLNAFAPGWGSRKLADDDLGPDITIATSPDTHRQQWLDFLQQSLAPDSPVKFFLFYCEQFYSDNEHYGHHAFSHDSAPDHLAHLENSSAQDLVALLVNRLFTSADGSIINLRDTPGEDQTHQGLQIFNAYNPSSPNAKINGYCFAPAIRLTVILRKVLASAGLSLIGSFATDPRISRLYLQSMAALDGDIYQYQLQNHLFLSGIDYVPGTPPYLGCIPINQQPSNLLFNVSPFSTPFLRFQFLTDLSDLQRGSISDTSSFDTFVEAYMLLFLGDSETTPPAYRVSHYNLIDGLYGSIPTSPDDILEQAGLNRLSGDVRHIELDDNNRFVASIRLNTGFLYRDYEIPFVNRKKAFCIQLTPSARNNSNFVDATGSFLQASMRLSSQLFSAYGTASTNWSVSLRKCKVKSCSSYDDFNLSSYGSVELRNMAVERLADYQTIDTADIAPTDNILNIFSRLLAWRDHVPDLSNGEFLKALCQCFGLNLFVGIDNTIQFSFFADIANAGSLCIDDYCTSSRKLAYEPRRYEVSLPTLKETSDLNPNVLLDPVDDRSQLPDPQSHKNRHALVRNENAYRRSEKDDDNATYSWQPGEGNDSTLSLGPGDAAAEEVKPDVSIPNMRWCDDQRVPKYLLQVNTQGCSAMLDIEHTGKFPFILQQYRGRRLIQLQTASQDDRYFVPEAYIEDANPTWFNADGSHDPDAINLAATGQNSLGELWQRPLYDFLANKEDFEFVCHLPYAKFLDLYRLMQPQNVGTQQQVRWIMYRSQRYLPSKISYEFSRSSTVIATITCHRHRQESANNE